MTNKQIITQAAIDNGVITQEQAEKYRASEIEVPFHSYRGWLSRGRKVRDGEEPTAVVTLWQRGKDSDAEPTEIGEGAKFYRHKTSLYTVGQTDRYFKVESEVD